MAVLDAVALRSGVPQKWRTHEALRPACLVRNDTKLEKYMVIRPENTNDWLAISRLHYVAFTGHPTRPEGAKSVEHRIVELLREADALSVSLVAESGGEIAGHIALSPCTVGEEHEGWYLLGPIGVLPVMQKQGIGSALMHNAFEVLRKQHAKGIVLVGDPAYYKRFGFLPLKGLTYTGVPSEYVLGLGLSATLPRGEIVAHRAFREACD